MIDKVTQYVILMDIFVFCLRQSVDWSMFGFDGRDGGDSTMWIGSAGAHTPCHYDTYGCNLVAQIYGRYIC